MHDTNPRRSLFPYCLLLRTSRYKCKMDRTKEFELKAISGARCRQHASGLNIIHSYS